MIKCIICSEEFEVIQQLSIHLYHKHKIKPKDYYIKYLNNNIIPKCKQCNKDVKFISLGEGFREFCSVKCLNIYKGKDKSIIDKRKRTNQKKYGGNAPLCSNKIKKKLKETNLRKYGVENVFQLDKVKEKLRHTNLKKYKVDNYAKTDKFKQFISENNPMKNEFSRKKYKQTMLNKYGVEYYYQLDSWKKIMHENNPMYNNDNKKKLKKTMINRYGMLYVQTKEFRQFMSKNIRINSLNKINDYYNNDVVFLDNYTGINKTYTFLCKNCNKNFKQYINQIEVDIKCPYCKQGTYIENSIKNILDKYNIKYYVNDRQMINPYELDFYLPDYNIAIECHGLYWHREQIINDRYYHYKKYKLCQKVNIQLLQFFENEILNNISIVESIILSKIGKLKKLCGARETHVKEINIIDANNFLNSNHIQGAINFKTKHIAVGAFYEDILVAVMVFNKENNKINNYLLNRFATLKFYNIAGVASKLLRYFIRNYDFNHIISFSDNRISNGNLYNKLHFKFVHNVKPSYYYIINNNLYHKFNFRKNKLGYKLKHYDSKLSEYENMLNNGIDRIWDAGKVK